MIDDFRDIKGSYQWESVTVVDKGWSNDKKYHILCRDGRQMLLRLSKVENYEIKKAEFEIIKKISVLDFDMSSPYDFGLCKQGVYMLLSWISGCDMEEALVTMSSKDQYKLGYEAGQILKKIHGLAVEGLSFSWEDRFSKKMAQKIKTYEACPLKYHDGHYFIDYLNRSKDLLKDRPIVLQHGDYHVSNMIYSDRGTVGIIDFNRFDYGDPWEEFNRIVWDVQVSEAFASGRVDGYFEGDVPEGFFDLLALYIASNTLSSLPWALQFGETQIEVMKKQAARVLWDFNNFESCVPRWYRDTKKKLKEK